MPGHTQKPASNAIFIKNGQLLLFQLNLYLLQKRLSIEQLYLILKYLKLHFNTGRYFLAFLPKGIFSFIFHYRNVLPTYNCVSCPMLRLF